MNTDRLARATFVLDRSTVDGLAYLSRRLRASRSEIVRGVLTDPVHGMVSILSKQPEDVVLDPRQLALDGLDMIESVNSSHLESLRVLAGESGDV